MTQELERLSIDDLWVCCSMESKMQKPDWDNYLWWFAKVSFGEGYGTEAVKKIVDLAVHASDKVNYPVAMSTVFKRLNRLQSNRDRSSLKNNDGGTTKW